jgi:hypothetical protein
VDRFCRCVLAGSGSGRTGGSSTRQPGRLDPPLEGAFVDGSAVFEGPDVLGGRPAVVRFRWTQHPTTPRWEQEFSFDAGETFVLNWTMDFSR